MTADERGLTRWLEGTEFDTALGIRFGKNVTPEVTCEPLLARMAKGIKSLEGMCWAPYGRAVLAQSLVVPIMVYFARVVVIPDEMIKALQKMVIDYVWTSNSQEAKIRRVNDPTSRIQHLVGDKSVMRRRAEGGLPLQHIASIVLANQASFVLRLLTPQQETYKSLPRYWVSEAGFPGSLGFSHLLSSVDAGASSGAPDFYQRCVRAFRSVMWTMDAPQTVSELGNVPLWRNKQFGSMEPTKHAWMQRLANNGVRYVGQMLSPVEWKIPAHLPMDPSGGRRYPDAETVVLRLVDRMNLTARVSDLIKEAHMESVTADPRPLRPLSGIIMSFDGAAGELQHLPVLWKVEPPVVDGDLWQGKQLDLDRQGKWNTTERRSTFTQQRIAESLHVGWTMEGDILNVYGAGDVDLDRMKLYDGKNSTPVKECRVRDLYRVFNKKWCGPAEKTAGLTRITGWVRSTGYLATWLPATCRAMTAPIVAAEERNLLWLILHSAVRLGYRLLGEMPTRLLEFQAKHGGVEMEQTAQRQLRAECNCPVCGFGCDDEHTEGETLDHAYGTCMELRALWEWLVVAFLKPAGGKCATQKDTVAAHLIGVAQPAVVAGMLGLILNADAGEAGETAVQRARHTKHLHGWWAMVRGVALLTIDRFRQLCKTLFEKHGERFQRPGITLLKEQIKMRLRLRVQEEVAAARSGKLTKGHVGLGEETVQGTRGPRRGDSRYISHRSPVRRSPWTHGRRPGAGPE